MLPMSPANGAFYRRALAWTVGAASSIRGASGIKPGFSSITASAPGPPKVCMSDRPYPTAPKSCVNVSSAVISAPPSKRSAPRCEMLGASSA